MHFAFAFELYLAIAKLYMLALASKLYIMVIFLAKAKSCGFFRMMSEE